ncbi:four-carbon acid sugar kinase family protein [Dyadobacter sp. LHD-138]|uniref:four-carbon acid sugar kinase family protein n=1 Tax=Dyadobacter sp. LHD-138 TaxID=3071413 RepID=UPI0027DEB954|nr:four-carbon acid sugar kinase family protein [Dyadobacter sp. LHD-138]MDQ6479110.1 four-carbon acid sugar kinase family protein [Dyadobacter sp. LHD-138]
MPQDNQLLIAYYGDDFTGSTDVLETLSKAGIKTALFIEPPTLEQLSRYKNIQAIGIAGMSRAMNPEEMEKELRPAFTALKESGARHVHYKVCSTFDSSPTVGSIGRAIDIGSEIFQPRFVSLVVAAPGLGRYSAFGNLFARMGIGSQGEIHRLDRHPSMSKHPVTPSDESDIRLHLGKQTHKQSGLIDILQIEREISETKHFLKTAITNGAEIVLFDAIYPNQMAKIGELIDAYGDETSPHFSAGSSGIELALGDFWIKSELIKPPVSWPTAGRAAPLLVVSGSCSPVTSSQITWALSRGFEEVYLDTESVAKLETDYTLENEIQLTCQLLNEGKSVIVHTSKGTNDPRFPKTNDILTKKGLNKSEIQSLTSRLYGTALGKIARSAAAQASVKRLVIAGGDTSSIVARTIGIEAVEMITPISPGAPLCRAFAPGSPVDGLEVVFKGGQVGGEGYFGVVLRGVL